MTSTMLRNTIPNSKTNNVYLILQSLNKNHFGELSYNMKRYIKLVAYKQKFQSPIGYGPPEQRHKRKTVRDESKGMDAAMQTDKNTSDIVSAKGHVNNINDSFESSTLVANFSKKTLKQKNKRRNKSLTSGGKRSNNNKKSDNGAQTILSPYSAAFNLSKLKLTKRNLERYKAQFTINCNICPTNSYNPKYESAENKMTSKSAMDKRIARNNCRGEKRRPRTANITIKQKRSDNTTKGKGINRNSLPISDLKSPMKRKKAKGNAKADSMEFMSLTQQKKILYLSLMRSTGLSLISIIIMP
jgi:hypothetical protein